MGQLLRDFVARRSATAAAARTERAARDEPRERREVGRADVDVRGPCAHRALHVQAVAAEPRAPRLEGQLADRGAHAHGTLRSASAAAARAVASNVGAPTSWQEDDAGRVVGDRALDVADGPRPRREDDGVTGELARLPRPLDPQRRHARPPRHRDGAPARERPVRPGRAAGRAADRGHAAAARADQLRGGGRVVPVADDDRAAPQRRARLEQVPGDLARRARRPAGRPRGRARRRSPAASRRRRRACSRRASGSPPGAQTSSRPSSQRVAVAPSANATPARSACARAGADVRALVARGAARHRDAVDELDRRRGPRARWPRRGRRRRRPRRRRVTPPRSPRR